LMPSSTPSSFVGYNFGPNGVWQCPSVRRIRCCAGRRRIVY
jgi:hypothetical protein